MGNVPNNPALSFEVDTRELRASLAQLGTLFTGTAGRIEAVTTAFIGMGAAQKFISGSINEFKGFNDQIARTSALSSATRQELRSLSDTAQTLGRTTEYTASQVAGGMSDLALAGFKVDEIVSSMPGLLATATAGLSNLSSATQTASQVLRAFHIDSSNMNYVAGALTATFTSTNTILSDLDYTMKYAGADAHELGVSLSQLSAAAGILGNVGIRGTIAGTGIREFIARLGSTLAENRNQLANTREALKQLGVTYKDVSDEAGNLSLVKAVDALEQSFQRLGMTAEEKLRAMRPIFGARAGTQITALIGQGSEVLKAKELEVTFGGMKQQLDGLLEKAMRLPEGVHGIKVSSKEIAENFITIGNQGAANISRISAQMRDLGLVGGFLNTQLGVTRESVKKIDGKVIKSSVFVPMEELGKSTYRTVDTLVRLQNRLKEIGDEAEKMAILEDVFGADPRVLEQAIQAFEKGGSTMAEFANQIIRSTSALDVQKKQLNTVTGSLKLMQSAYEGMQIQFGAVFSPLARIFAMVAAGTFQAVSGTTTLSSVIADFQDNTGGVAAQLADMAEAMTQLSTAGKILAAVGVLITAAAPFAAFTAAIATIGAMAAIPQIGAALTALVAALSTGAVALTVSIGLLGRYYDSMKEAGSTASGLSTIYGALAMRVRRLNAIFNAGEYGPKLLNSQLWSRATKELLNFSDASKKLKDLWTTLDALYDAVFGELLLGKTTGAMKNLINAFDSIRNSTALINIMWSAVIETMVYTVMDLLPAMLKGFSAIGDAIGNYGTIAMPTTGVGDLQQAGPAQGVAVAITSNFEYVIGGLMNSIDVLASLALRLVDAVLQAVLVGVAQIIALIAGTIANLTQLVIAFFGGIVRLVIRALVIISNFIQNINMIIIRFIISSMFYLASATKALVVSVVRAVLQMIQVAFVQIPLMFLNGFLHIIAMVLNFLSQFSTLMIRFGATIIASTINWTMYLFTAILKITAAIALLPVTLPYLAYKAFQLLVEGISGGIKSGSGAIMSIVQNLFSTLWEIAQDFLNKIKAGAIRQLKELVSIIFGVLTSIFSLPMIIATIIAKIYTVIDGALTGIYSVVVNWLNSLPYTIAHYIMAIWNVISTILSSIISFIGNIITFVGKLVIRGLTTVYKIFASLVTELPFLILKIVAYGFQAFVSGFLSTIILAMMQIKGIVYNLIANFRIYFVTQIERTFNIIRYGIPNMLKMIQDTAKIAITRFAQIVKDIVINLPNWLAGSLVYLANYLRKVVVELPQMLVNETITALNSAFDTIMDVIFDLLFGLINISGGAMSGSQQYLVNAAVGYITKFPGLMIEAIAKAWKSFRDGMSALYDRIKSVDWVALGNIFIDVLGQISDNIINSLTQVVTTIVGIATGGAENFADAVSNWINFEELEESFGGEISTFFDNFATKVMALWSKFVNKISGLWTLLLSIDWWGIIIKVLQVVYNKILEGVTFIRRKLDSLPTGTVGDTVKKVVNSILDVIVAGVRIAAQIMPVIRDNWTKLMSALYKGAASGVNFGLKFVIGGLTLLASFLYVLGKVVWSAVEAVAEITGVFGELGVDAALASGNFKNLAQQMMDGFAMLANGDWSNLALIIGKIILKVTWMATKFIALAFVGVFLAIEDAIIKQFPILGRLVVYMLNTVLVVVGVIVGTITMAVGAITALTTIALSPFIVAIGMVISGLVTLVEALYVSLFALVDLAAWLATGFTDPLGVLMGILDSVWNSVKQFFGLDKTVHEMINDMIDSVINGIINTVNGVMSALGAFFGFGGGATTEFADGGVVSRPTMLGSNTRAGEAGNEGILPLQRGRGGKLGVMAMGGGGGSGVASAFSALGQVLQTLKDSVLGAMQIGVGSIVLAISANAVSNNWGAIKGTLGTIASKIPSLTGKVASGGSNIMGRAVAGTLVGRGFDKIVSMFSGGGKVDMLKGATGAAGSTSDAFLRGQQELLNGTKNATITLAATTKGFGTKIMSHLGSARTATAQFFSSATAYFASSRIGTWLAGSVTTFTTWLAVKWSAFAAWGAGIGTMFADIWALMGGGELIAWFVAAFEGISLLVVAKFIAIGLAIAAILYTIVGGISWLMGGSFWDPLRAIGEAIKHPLDTISNMASSIWGAVLAIKEYFLGKEKEKSDERFDINTDAVKLHMAEMTPEEQKLFLENQNSKTQIELATQKDKKNLNTTNGVFEWLSDAWYGESAARKKNAEDSIAQLQKNLESLKGVAKDYGYSLKDDGSVGKGGKQIIYIDKSNNGQTTQVNVNNQHNVDLAKNIQKSIKTNSRNRGGMTKEGIDPGTYSHASKIN